MRFRQSICATQIFTSALTRVTLPNAADGGLMAPKYVTNIQILRFFAALSVALAHIGVAVEEHDQVDSSVFRMVYPFDWGLGVDVFFIISGFIMYYLMRDRFGEPGISGKFLRRRLIRVVPLYWACTTLMVASILSAKQLINNNVLDPVHLIASYLFIPWPRANGEIFPVFSLGWTLNYEIIFYIVFAIALSMSRRSGLIFAFLAFSALVAGHMAAPESWWFLHYVGDWIIFEFLIGIALAAIFLNTDRRISPLVAVAFMVVGVLLAVIFYQTGSYTFMPRLVTGGIPAAFIFIGAVFVDFTPKNRVARWLEVGGDASYALYLVHAFTANIVAIIGGRLGLPSLVTFGVGVVVSVGASVVTYRFFERPITNFLNQRFGRV
ncbi:acyltransferase family protein [Allorhizobium borbori]|nr:acyltransferase [Allorhizobium borbori]